MIYKRRIKWLLLANLLKLTRLADADNAAMRAGVIALEAAYHQAQNTVNNGDILFDFDWIVEGYGCHCHFGAADGGLTPYIEARGPIQDLHDSFCKQANNGYHCSVIDSAARGDDPICVPWQVSYVPYDFVVAGSDVDTHCETTNAGDQCAIEACIIETNYVIQFFADVIDANSAYDQNMGHDNAGKQLGPGPFNFNSECLNTAARSGTEHQCCGVIPNRFVYNAFDGSRDCCSGVTFLTSVSQCCASVLIPVDNTCNTQSTTDAPTTTAATTTPEFVSELVDADIEADCTNKKLDLMFLLDSSSGLDETKYNSVKDFVKNTINFMDIAQAVTRVSMIQFWGTPTRAPTIENFNVEFDWTNPDITALEAAVDGMDTTHTDDNSATRSLNNGLAMVNELMHCGSTNPTCHKRINAFLPSQFYLQLISVNPSSIPVVILLTDGLSVDDPTANANLLRIYPPTPAIHLFAVGISDHPTVPAIDIDQLKNVADDPDTPNTRDNFLWATERYEWEDINTNGYYKEIAHTICTAL